ncbi:MAG: hypothetical protein WC299_15035, partial [Kiritimatiellia bacterium]
RKGISLQRQKLYRLRAKIGAESHRVWREAKLAGSMDLFGLFFHKANADYVNVYFSFRRRAMYRASQFVGWARKVFKNKAVVKS